jgi:hypothetical protein
MISFRQSQPSRKIRLGSTLALTVAMALAALCLPGVAAALPTPTLFETTGGTGSSSVTPPPSELYRVDPATGVTSSVGNTGYAIGALAQDPTTGILYAESNATSPGATLTLLTLDPATGAATAVGSSAPQRIADMSFDSSGRLFGWSEDNDELVSIDKATGVATVVAPNEINTYGSASAFDRNDNYWLFAEGEGELGENNEGSYYTVDTATGVPTLRGRLSPIDENQSSISAASYDCARTTLYATVNNYGKPPANLVTIDTATGTLTNKGATVTAADGLEWYCPLGFEFSSTSATLQPTGTQTVAAPVVRGPRIKGTATVAFATQPGSAQPGRDYVPVSGILSFANNVAAATIPLTVTPDPSAGENRTFTLALSNPSSGGSIANGTYTVTVDAAQPKGAKIKGPKKTTARRPVFTLRSEQLPASFRCKLDKGKFKACGQNSPKGKKYKTRKLKPGKHKLAVQVVNAAGLQSQAVKKKFVILAKG